MSRRVILFGYGKFGVNIADTIHAHGVEVLLVESDQRKYRKALEHGFEECRLMDVTRDEELETLPVRQEDQLVCVMDDDHLNVFLVLSLRALFPNNKILAISDSIHATQKLKMAGANKVIDLYAVSANRIHNILNKPIATRFLEGFVDHTHEYSFREIVIPEGSFLHGKMLREVDFHRYGIIFVGMIDAELGNSFIFVTTGLDHKLDSGDIIVCIGHDEDLDRFAEAITKEKESTT
jgi:voltage-gated potassium channel